MPRHRRTWVRHAIIFGAVLVASSVAAPIVGTAFWGRAFLYHPTRLPADELDAAASLPGWRRTDHAVGPGVRLQGLVRAATAPGAPWLVFFGGNATSLVASQRFVTSMALGEPWGLATFAYRGYDGSGGQPQESALEADAVHIVDRVLATASITSRQLMIVGYSLGTGIAASVAAALAQRGTPPGALVLLAPYTSIAAIFDAEVPVVPVGWVVPDPYRTEALVPRLRGIPTLIVHGADDRLIPPVHGRRLAAALRPNSTYVEVPGTAHQVCDDPRAGQAVREFVRRSLAGSSGL
jgi:pimeloyl-ACP methyl ester carboxylesterase